MEKKKVRDFTRRLTMTENKEIQKCAWCKREGEMKYAAIRGPRRYFCSNDCLHKWEWFNRNGQDWLNVKETSNGEKKN